jgi:hypothetical protein
MLKGGSTVKRLIEFPLEEGGSKQAWDEGHIADKYTYEVERDYWEWEAAVTDEKRLREMLEELL